MHSSVRCSGRSFFQRFPILSWGCRMRRHICWGSDTVNAPQSFFLGVAFGFCCCCFFVWLVFWLLHASSVVTITHCLQLLEPREAKSVFSISLQNKTHGWKSWCAAQLFIYLLFLIDFFPVKTNQSRKPLVLLVVVNVESLSINPVKGKC